MAISRLETLPTETLYIIIDFLLPWDIRHLGCASKPLREACLPSLFRRVEIRFSEAGFDKLKNLMNSDIRYHVNSFTYVVPTLMNAVKVYLYYDRKVLDFDRFKSDLLTPDSYVETAKDLYDAGGEADECPPYMVIYETMRRICQEQRSIIADGVDLSVLSSTLGALPRLTDVDLSFCDAIEEDDWLLSSFASDMIVVEESHEYHVRIVSDALQMAKAKGVAVSAMSLSWLDLPYHGTWEVPDLSTLSESLEKLLESVQVLRVVGSDSALELLSHSAISLCQLDMCRMVVEYNTLEDFLETHKRSVRSIGVHDIKISERNHHWGKPSELSTSLLRKMLKVPQSTPYGAYDCGCRLFRKRGWRLLLQAEERL